MKGKVLIFSAPSGSGKSTIIEYLLSVIPDLRFSISATSRQPRGNERNGVEYYFFTPEQFKAKVAAGEFLEYEEVYPGRFYGTLRAPVDDMLAHGINVAFDVDVVGGCNIKKAYGDEALSIFIKPPSVAELRRRLISRGTDAPEAIEQRVAKAEYELTFAGRFDRVIVNDNLDEAKRQAFEAVTGFLRITEA